MLTPFCTVSSNYSPPTSPAAYCRGICCQTGTLRMWFFSRCQGKVLALLGGGKDNLLRKWMSGTFILAAHFLFLYEHRGDPIIRLSSAQFSCSVVSDSLWSHELQYARPPCPSPTPGVYSNSCPSSQWCHPAISSSVVPLSSCPQSLPASGSFPMSQLFAWGGQSIGVSASASVLPMNTQDWSPLGWTGWISLQSTEEHIYI